MDYSATSLLYDVASISALLFIAKIIRSKVRLVQRLYIPSALIAGFLGLIFGKQLIPPAPFEPPVRTFRATILVPESQIFR